MSDAMGGAGDDPAQALSEFQLVAISDLVDRYCQVWSEPDAGRRAWMLGSVWAIDASYTDPFVHAQTSEELLSQIAAVQLRRPGSKVLRTSQVDIHHNLARFAWRVVQVDGTALPEGLDLALIAPDRSRIERVIGFFGPLVARR